MAESVDAFEAAMAAMNNTQPDQESSGKPAQKPSADAAVDPFEAAKSALDQLEDNGTGAAGDSEDSFDTALAALEAVSSDDEESGETSTGIEAIDDPFAAALEVAKSEHSVAEAKKPGRFEGQEIDIEFLMEIKFNLTFEVGRTKMFISDLLSLGQGSVIELHRLVGEELDIFVNGQLLATGEVVVVNEKFGAKIVQILSPEDRLNRLAPTLS